ncbi:hypothetical protein CONLIGDRAFT_284143 [Coniochaeta ligniaria NRRL 30616]|uniref:Uncharacterized protein n=1 Tax=Coniochaeta ligniaria NRRL 30616 TaxID=1408157 RepID=A0A1J7ISH0_9PEZI|nr:hypothetical protein CONLIGDRAFT_284143 [Coniochaeta ligniaria NRRL 30616]
MSFLSLSSLQVPAHFTDFSHVSGLLHPSARRPMEEHPCRPRLIRPVASLDPAGCMDYRPCACRSSARMRPSSIGSHTRHGSGASADFVRDGQWRTLHLSSRSLALCAPPAAVTPRRSTTEGVVLPPAEHASPAVSHSVVAFGGVSICTRPWPWSRPSWPSSPGPTGVMDCGEEMSEYLRCDGFQEMDAVAHLQLFCAFFGGEANPPLSKTWPS